MKPLTPLDVVIKELGLKKTWVASQIGISRNTLTLLLKGETNPTIIVALKLARLLNKTVEELWGHLVD